MVIYSYIHPSYIKHYYVEGILTGLGYPQHCNFLKKKEEQGNIAPY